MALRSEFIVICKFLKESGVAEHFNGNADGVCYTIACRFLYTWVLVEQALSTIRNFGHRNGWLYFPDDSYAVVSENGLESVYATEPTLTDYRLVSRHGMDYYTEALRVTTKLLNARLDESEVAVMTVILLDVSTRKSAWSEENPVAQLLAAAFRSLEQHCRENYSEFTVRLDNLMQLAHDFENLRHMYNEHNAVMRLYGKQTVQSEIESKLQSVDICTANALYSLTAP
ncbi:hypothetical protein AAVH_11519 [Aphelenchoides avenae]|nr:hypothetical protein AAVH_11517 [Aphelenchus avenae]KAH7721052.1 hypothetical protein AAVH_11519 [Aphelenchus avenae]